jgi:uncharacterized membrane protein YqjE
MERSSSSSSNADPNLAGSVINIAKNIFGLLLSRIELASLELAEARSHLLKLVLIFIIGMITVWFAVAYWTMLVVFLTWEALGWKILLIIAALFTLLALGLFRYATYILRQGTLSLPATMAELRNDRDALL